MTGQLLAPLLSAALAAAQPAPAPAPAGDCRDDRGTDRCAPEQQARMRALYGVLSIEAHRDAGDRVRRVFYVNGYGRDLVMIAFLRAPGRDPTLSVHFPQPEGAPRPEPLTVPVSQALWDEVDEAAANFEREIVPLDPPPGPGEEEAIRLCLHAWVYTIEAVDRAGPGPARIRRKTEDACQDGPAEVLAARVARIALPLFPHCAALDLSQYRNRASALAACSLLHGDRIAAAEALNLAQAFEQIGRPEDAARLAGLFADTVAIDWGGEGWRGRGIEAAPLWVERTRPVRGWTNIYFERAQGLDADRVRLTGLLSRTIDTPAGAATGFESAPVEMIWARRDGELKVERAAIGRWERRSP